MSYTSPDRPGDPPIPPYKFVPGVDTGCTGCAFRLFTQTGIRCSRIPCQRYPGMVAKLLPTKGGAA